MKFTAIILLSACLTASATGYSQITLSEKNVPLQKVFKEIQKQSGYDFFYTYELIEQAGIVTVQVKNVPLEKAVEECLKGKALTFEIINRTVVIKKLVKDISVDEQMLPVDVHGRVVNEEGEPVEGASIKVKGTSIGTTTDGRGNFELKGLDEKAVLSITGTNIESFEVSVKGKTDLYLKVQTKVSSMQEVVVNKGYYSTAERLNTGSVSKVTSKDIERQPVTNPLAVLQGRVPGLLITQSNGVPGSSFQVQIRGQNSIVQGSTPLFVIDGVPFASDNNNLNQYGSALGDGITNGAGLSPFSLINTADIESIEILKDADATAIYGSRGANGVILITTKKGKQGKLTVNADFYSGVSKPTHLIDMLDTKQYLEMRHEAFDNDGIQPTATTAPDLLVWDTTRYTDFKKLLLGHNAPTTDAQLSMSGGSNTTSFLLGGSYHQSGTVYPGNFSDKRGTVHLNLNQSTTDHKFNIGLSAMYSSDVNDLPSGDFTQYLYLSPNLPSLYDPSGHLNWQQDGVTFTNPLNFLFSSYKVQSENLLANVLLTYNIGAGFSIRTSIGYNTIQSRETGLTPLTSLPPTQTTASSYIGNNSYKDWIIEPQAEYKRNIGKGQFDFIIGVSLEDQKNINSNINGGGYTSDNLLQNLGAATDIRVGNGFSNYRYEAVYSRLNYNWKDKYIVNLTARRDGSSRFGPGKQFGNFGALGAAWLFSNEEWFKDHLSFVSFGKLRASYGTSGNDQIGNYQYLLSWTNTSYAYAGNAGLQPVRLFNPDYSWEVNKKFEVNLDLDFFNRIQLSATYFRNRSGNQLVNYRLPYQTGFNAVIKNLNALVQNKGYEFTLNTLNISNSRFKWNTFFTLSFPNNKLLEFPGLSTSSYATTYIIGKSLATYGLYHSLGVNPETGVYNFYSTSGSPIAPVYPDDAVYADANPQYYGGLGSNLSYRSFEFSLYFTFTKQRGPGIAGVYDRYTPGSMNNQPMAVLDRWRKPGDNSSIAKFATGIISNDVVYGNYYYALSDAGFTDASYARLKNMALSYSFPPALIKRIGVTKAKVYVAGQNLLTFTSYEGNDPETLSYNTLPPLRTITAGVQLTF